MYPEAAGSGGAKKTIIIIVLAILLVVSLAFGFQQSSKAKDYKDNVDQKIATAVAAANKTQADQLQAQFAEQSKSPNKTYHGSATYGSVTFDYPKTWSAYVDTSNSNEPINGYFYPDIVPGIQSKTAYALRVELTNIDYSQLMQQFNSKITQGLVTSKAYTPPKMQGVANVVAGSLMSGQVNNQDQTQRGTLLAIKVRDKTLQIYTEAADFSKDFNNTVLATLTFAP
jgi:hypothetical protein